MDTSPRRRAGYLGGKNLIPRESHRPPEARRDACCDDVGSNAMEMGCADCECVVDRGVRVVVCADVDCCCSELAVAETARQVEPPSKG